MSADAIRDDRALSQKQHQPAKGGTERADDKPHPSGDSPKPHGDKFEHTLKEKR